MDIKGFAAYEPKAQLKPLAYTPQVLGDDDVLVKISHCGICHTDVHLIDNDWNVSTYPFIPGHEIIGVIDTCGKNVTHLNPGMRVGIGYQVNSCGACELCHNHEEHLCLHKQGTCVGRHGGYADYIVANAAFTIRIPEALHSATAAPLLCGGITVFNPLYQHHIGPHSRVGIIGIGGLGHLALQFASKMGAHVTAISSTPAKEAEAKRFGATDFMIGTRSHLTQVKNTFDFILSTVSADIPWQSYVDALKPKGKICVVGAAPGHMNIAPRTLISGSKTICGSSTGSPADIQIMLDFAAKHHVQAQVEILPLSHVNDALLKVRENTVRYRMVLDMTI